MTVPGYGVKLWWIIRPLVLCGSADFRNGSGENYGLRVGFV